jgi:serine/threonine protein kinase
VRKAHAGVLLEYAEQNEEKAMITETQCPPVDRLRAYSLGQLSEEDSNDLFDHLRSCGDCQSELETVGDEEDSLISSLRAPDLDDGIDQEPDCQLAIAKALGALATDGGPATATDLNLFPRSLGEYDIIRPLGRGGMGNVYLARHTKLGREVAVKVLATHRLSDQRASDRFEAEMRAVGQLSHPNIVTAHDAREVDGTAVLVTEYIDGLDVGEVISRIGPLPVADACEIVRQIAIALQYTSDQGFVHRDVKPSNIMLNARGDVKLLDLGLARLQIDGGDGVDITGTGQAMGTADYIAPEQVTDSRSVDVRADIYALGCTLFKLVSGDAPFTRPGQLTAFAKMTAHVSTAAPSLSDCCPNAPAALVKLVDSMLAKDPANRPQTPADVAQRLARLAKDADLPRLIETALSATAPAQPQDSTTASAASPATGPWLRRPVPVFIAIAAGLVGLFVGLCGGWLIKIKYPDGTQVEVGGPKGSEISMEWKEDPTPPAAASGLGGQPPPAGGTAATAASEPALLQFAVLPDESEASVMLRKRNDVPPSQQQQPLPPGSGIYYPVGEDVDVPMSLTHKGVRYQLVKDSPQSIITWEQIRGHIRSAMSRGGHQGTTIEIEFDASLAERMGVLTRSNLNRRMAIIFNGRIVSAPRILSEIGSKAMITGVFSSEEVRFLMQSIDGGLVVPMRGASTPPQEVVPDFAQRLQGFWKIDGLSDSEPVEFPDDLVVAFDGERYFVVVDGQLQQSGPYTLDEKPGDDSGGKISLGSDIDSDGDMQLGIYRFLGDGRLRFELDAKVRTRPPSALGTRASSESFTCSRIGEFPPDMASTEFKAIINSLSDGTPQSGALTRSVLTIMQAKQMGVEELLDARQRIMGAVGAQRTKNNLKQIGLGFHNFHDVYRKLPGSANQKEGSAGVRKGAKTFPFSWRVAILPFVEQQALFEQYRFDQPWDSESNLKLLDQMPEVYRSPFAAADQPSGHANYQGFVTGQSALGKDDGLPFREFRDGTSNTLLLVETKDSVPWTKPQDIEGEPEYFDDHPMTYLMCDGSVRTMDPIDKEKLAKMITRDGREIVQP